MAQTSRNSIAIQIKHLSLTICFININYLRLFATLSQVIAKLGYYMETPCNDTPVRQIANNNLITPCNKSGNNRVQKQRVIRKTVAFGE